VTGVAKTLQVEICRVTTTCSREIVKTSPPSATFPDVQQARFALGAETIQASILRDLPIVARVVEVMPIRPGNAAPVGGLRISISH
jgi:hypothetical protein